MYGTCSKAIEPTNREPRWRVGPTTPLSVTRAGVRLAAIGKGVRRASLLGANSLIAPGALRPIYYFRIRTACSGMSTRTGRPAGQG